MTFEIGNYSLMTMVFLINLEFFFKLKILGSVECIIVYPPHLMPQKKKKKTYAAIVKVHGSVKFLHISHV